MHLIECLLQVALRHNLLFGVRDCLRTFHILLLVLEEKSLLVLRKSDFCYRALLRTPIDRYCDTLPRLTVFSKLNLVTPTLKEKSNVVDMNKITKSQKIIQFRFRNFFSHF